MKKLFSLSLAALVLLFLVSCGDDDEGGSLPDTSIDVTFDGTNYEKSSDDIVAYIQFSFNDVSSYQISGVAVNGNDTIDVSISIPTLNVATYTKATSDDQDVSIDIFSENGIFSSDPFIFSDEEDPSTYTLNITDFSDNTLKGNFTATLYDTSDEVTVEASGNFVAVDFSEVFTFQ